MQNRSTRRQLRRRLVLSRAAHVQALESRLMLSIYYDYNVIASTGNATTAGDTIASFKGETSINDDGRVAFVANVTGPNGNGTAVITGDGHSTPVKISFPNPASGRNYDLAQITNDNLVVVKDAISGTDLVRTWNALAPGSNTIIVKDGDPSPPLNLPYEIVQLPTRANDGNTGFVGTVGSPSVYVKGAAVNTSLMSLSGGGYRPMIGNGGVVVVRTGVAPNQSIVVGSPTYGKILTAALGDFTAVSQPGISDDGQVVAFAGNSTSKGKGIYLSYFNGMNFTDPFKVAGLPNELGLDDAGNGVFLKDFDFSAPGATLSDRVGVVHRAAGAAGMADDTILLTFIATPSGAGKTNSHAGTPLLFNASKGIWTLKIRPTVPLHMVGTPAGAVEFDRRTSPMPVVQVGDTIGGKVITDFTLYDPIATPVRDESGAARATIDDGDNYVVFHAVTGAGDMVVRAAQLDTDSDGLYDHWERAGGGIDINLDGTTDLDINAMGANPMHKDLFLELDWLKPDTATGRNFSPQAAALTTFRNQFANAPLTNPDGTMGINVHVDAGPGLSQNMGAGSLQGGDNISHAGDGKHINIVYFGTNDPVVAFPGNVDEYGRPLVSRAFEDIKKNFFSTTDKGAREVAFKYALLADHYGVSTDTNGAFVGMDFSSGLAEAGEYATPVVNQYLPGNDFIISLAGFRGPANGRLTVPMPVMGAPASVPMPAGFFQSQTLAHELGHTLGLRHGGFYSQTSGPPGTVGFSAANYRQNYRSLMNYAFQLSPDTNGSLVTDYSRAGDANFDDWSTVNFDFNQYFETTGASPSYFSRGDFIPSEDPAQAHEQYTMLDVAAANGPLDASPPTLTINSPAADANTSVGAALTVNLAATDDGAVASVSVSFDANGDGVITPDEIVQATSTGGNSYQAVFNNVTGAAGPRTLSATATDGVGFTADQSFNLNVTTGGLAPPKVVASSFTFDALPHKLTFTFDQDVSASLATADFFIRKVDGTGQIIPTLLPYDSVNNRITLTLPGITPDGRYVVTLSSAGITNATGGQLDGDGNGAAGPDFDFNFFFLAGDANHDAAVNFTDLVALAQHYNTPASGPAVGDFNYDGNVDFTDLVTLAQRYNTTLPSASGLAASAASAPVLASTTTMTTTRELLSTFSKKRVVIPKPKPAPLHSTEHPAPIRKDPKRSH